VQDTATVTSSGESLETYIDGVRFRPSPVHIDERGELCEIFSSAWGMHEEQTILYAYSVMIRPGRVKGWAKHLLQDDRQFPIVGTVMYVLYDDRPDSPTHKKVQRISLSDRRRGLLVIPAGVYHAVQNIGLNEAFLVNLPSRPYNHASPDKYWLPLNNDLIPYDFTGRTAERTAGSPPLS
jgi:dTDP-4-dehydrorhamnose 3,5-epimerase